MFCIAQAISTGPVGSASAHDEYMEISIGSSHS